MIPIPAVSPSHVVAAAIILFVAYWLLALFVPGVALRDLFNAIAFGAQLFVVLTWWPAAYRAVKEESDNGAWLLIVAVFHICFVALMQRSYQIVFNWMERPKAWEESAISGFFPYSYAIAAMLFLVSPDVRGGVMKPRAWWLILSSAAVGGFIAGALFMTSLPSF